MTPDRRSIAAMDPKDSTSLRPIDDIFSAFFPKDFLKMFMRSSFYNVNICDGY